MKRLLFLFTFLPLFGNAQFGFKQDTTNSTIQVIKNGIQLKYPWVGGLDYCQFSNIDLDMDGVEDLYIFDKTSYKSLTFLQKGAFGIMDFEYAPSYEKVFDAIDPGLFGWVLLYDYDGDGKKDLFSPATGGVGVYHNISTISTGLSFELENTTLPSTIYGGASGVYVSQGDIPALVDVDYDGDMDVLSFYLNGSCVRYYKNLCQETYGHSDSLFFQTVSVCYGNFQEANSTNSIILNSCCALQVNDPEGGGNRPGLGGDDRHAGSTVLALDLDADNMMDLVLGDISYHSLTMLMNGGTVPNSNSSMVSQDNAFPSYDTSVDLPIYPGAYYVDVNNDNIRDLLVSPASTTNSQNFESNWFYQNTGADNFPVFEHQQNDFLQEDMIEFGSGALPVFFDYNGDGLKDLLVSIKNKYDPSSGNSESKIAYYRNSGTASNPEYTFMSDDYQGLSTVNGGNNIYLYPTFGDLDNDGDEDLLLGNYNGNIWFFENVSTGSTALFNSYSELEDQAGNTIYEGVLSVPKLVDLDRDGLLDLVLGKRTGKLSYYKNIGTATNAIFELQTSQLGGVDVSESWSTEGLAIPEFVDIDNTFHLVVGSKSGKLHYYNDIEGNLSGTFNAVSSDLDDIYTGDYSAPAIADIDGDNKLEMALGNQRGGLSLFESAIVTNVGLKDLSELKMNIYPVPAEQYFRIDLSLSSIGSYDGVKYTLSDLTGKLLLSESITQSNTLVDCQRLSKGVYLLTIELDGYTETKKIVLQ